MSVSPSPARLDAPAHHLAGRTLDGGWKVVSIVTRSPDATGGHFSVGYVVEDRAGGHS
jgi:hypothetical protein